MPVYSTPDIAPAVKAFETRLRGRMKAWMASRTPSGFRETELEIAAASRSLADEITAAVLIAMTEDMEWQEQVSGRAREHGPYRGGGQRPVTVTLLGGTRVTVRSIYLKPDRRGQRGRPRGVGRRGQGGSGLYPALAALGIWFAVSPGAAAEVCRQVADSDSVRAGREALARRDLDLGHKQTLRIVNRVGQRIVTQRSSWMERVIDGPAPDNGFLSGRRVVISTDGGRLRERVPTRGRRREATGHRRYDTPWREPKMIVVYVIDDNGRPVSEPRPLYDGTLGDCEDTFRMLLAYLKDGGAHLAKELIVVGDGAKWIWGRVQELVSALGIHPDRVVEVIDWYHAIETLHEIAGARKWDDVSKKRWVNKAKRLLFRGDIAGLLAEIDNLTKGRNAKAVGKHRDYFARNTHRMQYKAFKSRSLPLGSGAIESTVRRIVNMRMKANGTFWLADNAEGMLILRSYLKAGRFDDLFNWSLNQAAPWLAESDHEPMALAA